MRYLIISYLGHDPRTISGHYFAGEKAKIKYPIRNTSLGGRPNGFVKTIILRDLRKKYIKLYETFKIANL